MPPAPGRDHDPDELDPGDVRNTQPPDARPFVVALIGFVIVAVAAFFFLKEDDDLSVVRPDSVRAVDDDTVTAIVDSASECTELVRSQVDVSDSDTIFVELIVRTGDECVDVLESVEATIDLPEPIGDRRVVPGVGRVELPCDSSGRCGPEQ